MISLSCTLLPKTKGVPSRKTPQMLKLILSQLLYLELLYCRCLVLPVLLVTLRMWIWLRALVICVCLFCYTTTENNRDLTRAGIPIIQAVPKKEGIQSRYAKDLLGFRFLPEILLSGLISDLWPVYSCRPWKRAWNWRGDGDFWGKVRSLWTAKEAALVAGRLNTSNFLLKVDLRALC